MIPYLKKVMFIKKINIIVTLLWYIKLFGNNIKFHEHLQKKNFLISFNSCRKLEKHINNDFESDSEGENEIEHIGIDSHKQVQTKNDHLKQLQNNTKAQSLKKNSFEFPNVSNFDDTG